jgi:hypothetical protein
LGRIDRLSTDGAEGQRKMAGLDRALERQHTEERRKPGDDQRARRARCLRTVGPRLEGPRALRRDRGIRHENDDRQNGDVDEPRFEIVGPHEAETDRRDEPEGAHDGSDNWVGSL